MVRPQPDEDRKGLVLRVKMHKRTKPFKEFAPSSVESESLRTDQNCEVAERAFRPRVQGSGWSGPHLFLLTGLLGCLQVVMNVNELLMRS